MEERAIALERDPQIFGGNIAILGPLLFELRALRRERFGKAFDRVRNELVGTLHCLTRRVDETRLDLTPAPIELVDDVRREERLRRVSARRLRVPGRRILRVRFS